MALDKVIQAILDEGRKESERIVAEGRAEAEKILGEAQKEAQKLIADKSREADNLAARMKTQETARAEIESKKVVLKAQKASLDQVYDSALKKLSLQAGGGFIENILKQRSSEVSGGLVYSSEKDRQAVEGIVSSYGGRFGGTVTCSGGIIIESGDGTVRTDYRLETLLKDVWDSSIIDVTSLLWRKAENE
jgi:V/A-type H+-transporting ATPase subunit E